jgi:hypothetical protein
MLRNHASSLETLSFGIQGPYTGVPPPKNKTIEWQSVSIADYTSLGQD